MSITKKQELSNVPISKLMPYAKNPRKNDAAVQRVAKSLEEFGLVKNSIVVDEDMVLITGHTTTKAMQVLGWKNAPEVTQVFGLTAAQKQAYRIADNKLGELAEWDTELLGLELEELRGLDFDIELTGFDEGEFDDLLKELHKDDEVQDAEPQVNRAEELQKEWHTELGQMWQCGEHRVICGDCTDLKVINKLMGGKVADLVFTDPPYGIGVDIANDNLSLKDLEAWNERWLAHLPIKKDIAFICYHSTRTFPALLVPALKAGWFFERMLCLTRPDKFPVHAWNGWVLISQSIMLLSKGKPEYNKISPAEQDVYRYTSKDLGEHSGHPTEKILEHIISVMGHFKADIVVDPFLGSGTTMIACENTGRICYGAEVDPKYVAVILQRYKDTFPDKEIKLL